MSSPDAGSCPGHQGAPSIASYLGQAPYGLKPWEDSGRKVNVKRRSHKGNKLSQNKDTGSLSLSNCLILEFQEGKRVYDTQPRAPTRPMLPMSRQPPRQMLPCLDQSQTFPPGNRQENTGKGKP